MAYTIALAGKGGVGKTTITGMLIKYLAEKTKSIILAVDADANSNLNEVLGVEIENTLGDIREQLENNESKQVVPPGVRLHGQNCSFQGLCQKETISIFL